MEGEVFGYDDEQFTDNIPENLRCPVCLLVLREPHLLSCCGVHICQACISVIKKTSSCCPLCRMEDYETLLNKQLRGAVLSLRVKCCNERCSWEGELMDKQKHLDTRCEYAETKCQYGCGTVLTRMEIAVHERDVCPNLPVTVAISRFRELMTTKANEMSLEHQNEVKALNTKLKEQQSLTKSCLKKLENCEQEIMGLKGQLEQRDEEFKRMLAMQEEKHNTELCLLKERLARPSKLSIPAGSFVLPGWWPNPLPLSGQIYPPCILTMPNYSLQCKDTDEWFSPSFYSGPGGYRFCLRVRAIGQGSGLKTHVSVFVHLMKSCNDEKLKWPLSADIKVQVVNIREDRNHVELKIPFNDKMEPEARTRVKDKERAAKGIGFHEFIPRQDLQSYNAVKNTEYLLDDCILFRILSVNLLK